MKSIKTMLTVVALMASIGFSASAHAIKWQNGYFKSNGSYVGGHYKSKRSEAYDVYGNYKRKSWY